VRQIAGVSSFSSGDTDRALRLYEWNADVSAIFYKAIGQFEVLLYGRLKRLNKLRNRVAHYEPIHHMDLEAHYDDLLTVAGWIDPTTATWIWSTTSTALRAALAAKP